MNHRPTVESSATPSRTRPDLLEPFFAARIFGSAEDHLLAAVSRIEPAASGLDLLALAAALGAARRSHSCIDLNDFSNLELPSSLANIMQSASANGEVEDAALPTLPWPDPTDWAHALRSSPIVAGPEDADVEPLRPLVFDGQRFYLHRYWTYESRVASNLLERARISQDVQPSPTDPDDESDPSQARAVSLALTGGVTMITGGPGTGKTYTIARILTAAHRAAAERGAVLSVALAAPTGKAAARITESVKAALGPETATPHQPPASEATTIHRLLGWAPGDRFRHNRTKPLPHDLVIIDETSMVSLALMARLLDAVRPGSSLVLVGDPDQLASIEVGTVLSDLVDTPTSSPLSLRTARLSRVHRFGHDSPIADLASAVREGEGDAVIGLMESVDDVVQWVHPSDTAAIADLTALVVDSSAKVVLAALDGDASGGLAEAVSTKVLAATRHHAYGLDHWSELIEAEVASLLPQFRSSRSWFVGRPVMVTKNDRINRLANGDTGLVIAAGTRGSSPGGSPQMVVALPDSQESGGLRLLPPSRLADVETWWAMTIHKSQGSEFDHVVVSLPPSGSPVLSRELLYTAITRAKTRVTILADEDAIREAVARPVARASGLRARLS